MLNNHFAPMSVTSTVSICIPTYQRNERLKQLLDDLLQQSRLPEQVIIVDNHPGGGAKPIVEAYRARAPFTVVYDIQPQPNIALTRNRTVELATGEWMAFIDDDERAPKEWLQELLHAAEALRADGVLAPVEPQVPATAPAWIRRGTFYDFAHQPEGAEVPYECMRFGNVLLRGDLLRTEPGPFDPGHELMAGEDTDLLVRLARKGARIVWSEKAPVYEPIEPVRLSFRWLMLRALSGGQAFARYTVAGGFKPIGLAGCILFYLRAFVQMILSLAAALVTCLFGTHRGAAWLFKASANFGKLTALYGWRFRQYARRA